MTYQSQLTELKGMIEKIEYYKYTTDALIYWDKITYMPRNAIEYRSKVMSFLAGEQYRLLSDSRFQKLIRFFNGNAKNDFVTNAMIRRLIRNSESIRAVPEAEYQKYVQLIAVSEQVWAEAKEKNDFSYFRPYLARIFTTFRNFAEYWGYEKEPYDALLGYYAEDLTTETIDTMTAQLKPVLIGLLNQVEEKNKNGSAPKKIDIGPVSREQQQAVWTMILKKIGFNFDSGRVDIGSHPTILANSPDDIRVVNTFSENGFWGGIFNILHCGGRGVYKQSISRELMGTLLAESPTFAVEEAIGRFYENIIGRSKGFWQYIYEPLTDILPQLKTYTPQDLFEAVNHAQPSLIRLEADELTYLLHIIIRYELEKDLISGALDVDDLPDAWSSKYEEYLSIRPEHDGEGVLQDIHWAAGYVGFFPSYFMANVTAAQMAAVMAQEIGDLDQLMQQQSFGKINDWLTQNMYCYGAVYSGRELMEKVCRGTFSSTYYIDYLRNKYSEVYKLF